MVLALFLGGKSNSRISKSKRGIITSLIILCLYTLLVCVANVEFNSYTLGKPLRLIVFYALFIYLSGRLSTYKNGEIVGGVLLALLLHLGCVYGQFFFPSTKVVFTSFLRFDDKLEILEDPLRAFGLDASFDGAGLDICVLLVLLWLIFKRTKDLNS